MAKDLRTEISRKIDLLAELGINLTTKERCHFYTLTSEIQVENYARKLIMK